MSTNKIAQYEAEIWARLESSTTGDILKLGCGDWYYIKISDTLYSIGVDDGDAWIKVCNAYCLEDAEFIINAKPDLIWQRERIKALEEENARLGEAFETELWDKTTYLDLSEVQQKRIKELEAGLMSVEESKDESMEEAVAANHRWIEALMETFALKNASKWARRWKRLAIAKRDEICTLGLTQAVLSIALARRDERIAALENAARSCATCLRFDEVFEHEDCKRCEAVFEESGELFSAWTFDEARYAPKGNTEND